MQASNGNTRIQTAPDGTRIRIGCWPIPGEPAGTVILVHGRTEFLEKYTEVISELNHRHLDVWSMDWRGQGLSDRALRNREKGHIDCFDTYLGDLSWFVGEVVEAKSKPVILLAHSMGGHIAIRSVLEGSLDPDGLIVTAPMIALPIGQIGSLAAATFSRTMSCLGFDTHYGPGMADYDIAQVCFDGNTLTGDRDRFYRTCQMLADAPDLAVGGVTWGWISAAFLSMGKIQRLSKHVQPSCPALICTPMEDRVVSTEAQSALSVAVEGWNQVRFDGARHELLMETDNIRNRFWPIFDEFVAPL